MLGRAQLTRLFFLLLHRVGAEHVLMRKTRSNHLLTVLSLHQIRPQENPYWSPLSPELFDELLTFVRSRFYVTTFAGLAHNDTGKPPLVLSFDDGYFDFVEYAMPILDKHRLSANQNIIAQSALTGRPPDVVRVCDFLGHAPRSLIDEIKLPGLRPLEDESVAAKARYGTELCSLLKMRSRTEAAPLWAEVERHMSRCDFPMSRMMTVSDVRSAAATHEIGSHSFSHDTMSFEADTFFEDDLARSEAFFRDQLHIPLRIYAFPNGGSRPSQIKHLEGRRGIEHILLVGDDFSSANGRVHKRFNFYARSPAEARIRAMGFASARSTLRKLL
jgi:peptidoglycan/xylan/chitin deacetylase (PgdA/CDA1 family)